MKRWQDILGMNARNHNYLHFNSSRGRRIADSKLETKEILLKSNLPSPELIKTFGNYNNIESFNWEGLPDNFVLKPSSGFGGEGILVIRKKSHFAGEWELMDGQKINIGDLKFHAQEILSGRYSLHNAPDKAFIEERIKIMKVFGKYVQQGTPDIRIIVFNQIPVMAMLRLPTKESGGKANLHQGAVGVGIDLATGVTTSGIHHGQPIRYIPGTKRKVNGLKVPHWDQILLTAVKVQQKITSLGYAGIDFVISKNKGPLILELNARSGLAIQICNKAGLQKRLERVERLEIRNPEHAVDVAKALFAAPFADKVDFKKEPKVLGLMEDVVIIGADKSHHEVSAKIDTGADRSAIDHQLAEELDLLAKENIVYYEYYRSALGSQKRMIIGVTYYLKGEKIKTFVSVSDRSNLRNRFLIGKRDLRGFIIRP